MATWVQAVAVLTPPLNAPPFISPVLMKVGALIGGWQRKAVNQCKSWSCLKWQAMVMVGWGCLGHGMMASRGNSGVEASRSLCGIVWLPGIWGPSWFGFFLRCWVIFVYSRLNHFDAVTNPKPGCNHIFKIGETKCKSLWTAVEKHIIWPLFLILGWIFPPQRLWWLWPLFRSVIKYVLVVSSNNISNRSKQV